MNERYTIQIDSREKYPVLFPYHVHLPIPGSHKFRTVSIETERVALPGGDYRLKEYPALGGIERKGSIWELVKNLTNRKDMVRQAKAFTKLTKEFKFPYLYVETSLADLTGPNAIENWEIVLGRLAQVIVKYNLRLLWMPANRMSPAKRRQIGTFFLQILLAHALETEYNSCTRLEYLAITSGS